MPLNNRKNKFEFFIAEKKIKDWEYMHFDFVCGLWSNFCFFFIDYLSF